MHMESNGRPFSSFDLSAEEIEAEKKLRSAAWGEISQEKSEDVVPLKWKDVNALEFPEVPWRVKNLIPLEGLVILAAVSGGYKSWLALELARCICNGERFLGCEEFSTRKGKVLYVDAENPKSEIQRRGRQLGLTDDSDISFLSADSVNLNDKTAFFNFKQLVVSQGFDVVIIDTFRSVAGSLKEEKAEEVRTFFNRFKPFKDLGIVVIFLDHYRKVQAFEGKTPKKDFLLGSVDKVASVEVLLMLQSEPGSPELSLFQRKNRLSMEIRPFQMSIMDEIVNGGVRTRLAYKGEIADELNKKEEAKELILTLLVSVPGMNSQQLLSEAGRQQIGNKNVRKALKELVEEGLLDLAKDGHQNYYMLPKKPEMTKESLVDDELEAILDSS